MLFPALLITFIIADSHKEDRAVKADKARRIFFLQDLING